MEESQKTLSYNALQQSIPSSQNSTLYDFHNLKTPPTGLNRTQLNNMNKQIPIQTGPMNKKQIRPLSSTQKTFYNDKKQKSGYSFFQNTLYLNQSQTITQQQQNEQKWQAFEKQIHELLVKSATAKLKQDYSVALEVAQQAFKIEQNYRKDLSKVITNPEDLQDKINLKLQFATALTLALGYEVNDQLNEAIKIYNNLLKSKASKIESNYMKIKVNMGNLYYNKGKTNIKYYKDAIKCFHQALDTVSKNNKNMRSKLIKNIGHVHTKIGQYTQSIKNYYEAQILSPTLNTSRNLMICLYAQGDKQAMMDNFKEMVEIYNPQFEQLDQENTDNQFFLLDDQYRSHLYQEKQVVEQIILEQSKLIAPVIFKDQNQPENQQTKQIIEGYDYISEIIKQSNYQYLDIEIQVSKSTTFMKNSNLDQAIQTMKQLEKTTDKQHLSRISTNLAFFYIQQEQYQEAIKYLKISLQQDKFNSKALVNMGNCYFYLQNYSKSKESYLEAVGIQADCVEALFNLGYINKFLGDMDQAQLAFNKLQTIIELPEVVYQLGNMEQLKGNPQQALKWYHILYSKNKTDSHLLQQIALIYNQIGDYQQGFGYLLESDLYNKNNLQVIEMIGIFYVQQDQFEKAIEYFQRACEIVPKEIKYKLMLASCHRRLYNVQKAYNLYQEVHELDQNNIECLRFLVNIQKELKIISNNNLDNNNQNEYNLKLKKLLRQQESQPLQYHQIYDPIQTQNVLEKQENQNYIDKENIEKQQEIVEIKPVKRVKFQEAQKNNENKFKIHKDMFGNADLPLK